MREQAEQAQKVKGKTKNEIIRVQTIWSGRVFNDDIVSFHKTRAP